MVAPVSQLANMEMALYGGFGSNMNAPSYLNGYTGNVQGFYNTPNLLGNAYNPTFGQSIPQGYDSYNGQQAQGSVFQGLTQADQQALVDDYKKSLTPSEGFMGCLAGNAAFAAISNPRLIAHPINTWKATFGENGTNKFFNDLMKNKNFQKLWNTPENSNILREAWLQHNKALARCESKFGALRRGYGAMADKDTIKLIKEEILKLQKALNDGNIDDITKQTARLKHAYGANEGFLARGWNTVKGWFGGKPAMTVSQRLGDEKGIEKIVEELKNTKKTGFGDILKRGGGVKGGLFFMAIEYLMSFGKIKTAFEEDSSTGWKQLGQTTVKAAGNAAGWALGEAASVWAFTKWGAKIGSKINPLLGTLIGGAVGMIGGGIGMWLAGKGTKAVVGEDVADGITAKKLAQSNEGQVQLLQNTMQRIQSGEKVSPEAQLAIQKLMTQYA